MWVLNSRVNENFTWRNALSNYDCDNLIEMFDSKVVPSTVKDGMKKEARNRKHHFIEGTKENEWLFKVLEKAVLTQNKQFYNYDLTFIETLQFTKYEVGGYYTKHIDMETEGQTRKLSFSIDLSDPDDYKGGDLILYQEIDGYVTERAQGRMNFFPSTYIHEGTPVTKGVRYSLVGWVCGPTWL